MSDVAIYWCGELAAIGVPNAISPSTGDLHGPSEASPKHALAEEALTRNQGLSKTTWGNVGTPSILPSRRKRIGSVDVP